MAQTAGLSIPNVWGGIEHKRVIIETKGSGIAFFDYDNDSWLDIYLTNGSRLGAHWPVGKEPTTHLYKNNRDGTFTGVTENPVLAAQVSKPVSVLEATLTTGGTTCFALLEVITFSVFV